MRLKCLVLGAAALAIPDTALAVNLCKGGPKNQWISEAEAGAKLAQMGYSRFVLAVEDGCLEAKVLKDGRRLEIYMEPLTGEIVKTKEQ